MSTMLKVGIGCAIAIGLVVVFFASIVGFFFYKKARLDKQAVPFLDAYIVELSSWDPERVKSYWAPEVLAQVKPEQTERLFLMYQRLGKLKSHDRPEIRQVGAHTGIPYPELATYQVSAEFDAGPALLTIQLVRARTNQPRIWFLNIDSEAFLPPAESHDTSPPETAE